MLKPTFCIYENKSADQLRSKGGGGGGGGGGAGFFLLTLEIFFTDKGKHDFFFCQHSKPFIFFQVPLKLTSF